MSTFEVNIIDNITLEPHPNADSLSLVKNVGGMGYQVVVKTADFINESKAVYVPVEGEAAIPDHPLLGFLNGSRVKVCRLRGEVSQGLLIPFTSVIGYLKDSLGMKEDSISKVLDKKDLSGVLRIRRWYDTTQRLVSGDEETPIEMFEKYTDIENINKFINVIEPGTLVNITEKIHGTSARFGLIEDTYALGSRNRRIKLEGTSKGKSPWHFISDKYQLENTLKELKAYFSQVDPVLSVVLYGEIAGPGIQDLKYGLTEPGFFAYDIAVNNTYIAPEDFLDICDGFKIPTVPVLEECVPFNWDEHSLLRLGKSTLDSHVKEGIVIKPVQPAYHYNLGRVILKLISEEYQMRANQKDIRE